MAIQPIRSPLDQAIKRQLRPENEKPAFADQSEDSSGQLIRSLLRSTSQKSAIVPQYNKHFIYNIHLSLLVSGVFWHVFACFFSFHKRE